MILPDKTIKRLNLISENFNEKNLQPASYDLTLDLGPETTTTLKPGESRIFSTKEVVSLPSDVAAKTVGKSSFGRASISSADIAGFIDPGFKGNLTLNLTNMGDKDFILWNDTPFCQIYFLRLESSASKKYDGHYQNSKGLKKSIFSESDESVACVYGEISD